MIVAISGDTVDLNSEEELTNFFEAHGLPVPDWDYDSVIESLRYADPVHYLVDRNETLGFRIIEVEVL